MAYPKGGSVEKIMNRKDEGVFSDHSVNIILFLKAIKKGKYYIISTVIFFSVIAIIISTLISPTWKSEAIITKLSNENILNIKENLNDLYSVDSNIAVLIDGYISSGFIYNLFIEKFNDPKNKISFLNKESSNSNVSFDPISNIKIKKYNNDFKLRVYSSSPKLSYEILNKYIKYTNEVTLNTIKLKLNEIVNDEYFKLNKKYEFEYNIAKMKLEKEILMNKAALKVAEAAKIEYPLKNVKGDFVFPINLGSNLLKQRGIMLENIHNMAIFDFSLSDVEYKIKSLRKITFENLKFMNSFLYIEKPSIPSHYVLNKKIVIILLGITIGLIFGVFLALYRSCSCRK